MNEMFTLEMLPAADGDCLWIEYGDPANPKRILIDGGRARTTKEVLKRAEAVPKNERQNGKVKFELLVITHVDNDHVEGVLGLLAHRQNPLCFDDIWFNGFRHLDESESYGPVEGEKLTTLLIDNQLPWNRNKAFSGRAIVVQANRPPEEIALAGGMKLILLSPSREKLNLLKPVWAEACADAGLDPQAPSGGEVKTPEGGEIMGPLDINTLALSDFAPDTTETNGSSIALLARYRGHSVLLAGDAHSDLLLQGIERIKGDRKKLPVDAFKLPHHGSHRNVSRQLIEAVDCRQYLVSTGSSNARPARQTIARILKFGGKRPEIFFNSKSENCLFWNSQDLMDEFGYTARYPGLFGQDRRISLTG